MLHVMPPVKLSIDPPLLNSACPWATTADNLRDLLESPCTGAITIRTSILATTGFDHQPAQHRYIFFDPVSGRPHSQGSADGPRPARFWDARDHDSSGRGRERGSSRISSSRSGGHSAGGDDALAVASVNTLGYSPISLPGYLDILTDLSRSLPHILKTVIISVTGTANEVRRCHDLIEERRRYHHVVVGDGGGGGVVAAATVAGGIHFPLAMEINLSCPNINGEPPPAYSPQRLVQYLDSLPEAEQGPEVSIPGVPIGIKTPPFTYEGQFQSLADALASGTAAGKVSFVTATNTLGSCLLLHSPCGAATDGTSGESTAAAVATDIGTLPTAIPTAVLPGAGVGGMAGPPLHPLALGNVAALQRVLGGNPKTAHIDIIGVGGVGDAAGYARMRAAGASFVAVGTALGRKGLAVFEDISAGVNGNWQLHSSKL